MTISKSQLHRWQAVSEAATKGSWRHDSHAWSPWVWRECDSLPGVIQAYVFKCGSREDALFVAESRTAVPALLAEVERLRALGERACNLAMRLAGLECDSATEGEVEAIRKELSHE